ncbi:MAG: hypothetical protein WBG01_12520, partial [Bacteroidota bacterium]
PDSYGNRCYKLCDLLCEWRSDQTVITSAHGHQRFERFRGSDEAIIPSPKRFRGSDEAIVPQAIDRSESVFVRGFGILFNGLLHFV